ncbi:MAG: hypothetical protein ACKOEC_03745 [Acidimicrobiia bacterium]
MSPAEVGRRPVTSGTNDPPAKYGQRGKQRIGQYYEAFPDHAVALDQPLDDRVRAARLALAKVIVRRADGLGEAKTRGDFIRRAWLQRE